MDIIKKMTNSHSNRDACVCLQVYKNNINEYEKVSLRRLTQMLGEKYDIFLICPANVDAGYYSQMAEGYEFNIINLPSEYFTYAGYNKLWKTCEFFKQFADYEYILSYELDAYIFCDELRKFMDFGYDYIGAPWPVNWTRRCLNINEEAVGNSGFCMRKTESFIRQTENLPQDFHFDHENVDSYYFLRMKELNTAPVEIARTFSFDQEPWHFMEVNGGKLPMGCHLWWREKQYLDFYKQYINI